MTEAEKSSVDNRSEGSRGERDYSTKEWDDDSGLYYFGARYYSPEIGRWTQRDPAGTVDGLNLYPYVNNEPANRIDPWGLICDVYYFRAGVSGLAENLSLYTSESRSVWPVPSLSITLRL